MKGIIRDSFKVHYCSETIEAGGKRAKLAIPMISFCDIPLSQVKEHIGKYGPYGIGMTKGWATRMKLCPVQYIEKNSFYADSLALTINGSIPGGKSKNQTDLSELERSVIDFLRYTKNHEGDLERKDKTTQNYRYYDEREWRYVPQYDTSFPMLNPLSGTNDEAEKKALNKIITGHKLHFEPSDIKYIIVKNDSEISEFIDTIKNAKGNTYTHKDTERLTSRIITKEQIESDF
jgi:Putative abortive phage resistance protein AbiGi, antitoxin